MAAIVGGFSEAVEVTYINIGDLPLYNQDYDQESPQQYTEFRKSVASQDAFIFVISEHNRSIPQYLKMH